MMLTSIFPVKNIEILSSIVPSCVCMCINIIVTGTMSKVNSNYIWTYMVSYYFTITPRFEEEIRRRTTRVNRSSLHDHIYVISESSEEPNQFIFGCPGIST